MNIRFIIEETNLISIFICEERASLIEEISDALPYMNEDVLNLVNRTLEKFRAMIDEEFAGLDFYTADEKTPHARGCDLRAFRAAEKKDTRRRQAPKKEL